MSEDLERLIDLMTVHLGRVPNEDEVYNFIHGNKELRDQILREEMGHLMLDINKYLKKPFEVQAVQVTSDNIYEVAKWCQGDIAANGAERFIKVRVIHAVNERQTQAFVGDWVLYAGTSYRVYTDKAFSKSFEKIEEAPAGPLDAAAFSSSS